MNRHSDYVGLVGNCGRGETAVKFRRVKNICEFATAVSREARHKRVPAFIVEFLDSPEAGFTKEESVSTRGDHDNADIRVGLRSCFPEDGEELTGEDEWANETSWSSVHRLATSHMKTRLELQHYE